MPRRPSGTKRHASQISPARAARLFQLIGLLGSPSTSREGMLSALGIGLRTFYRELQLLKRCGIRVTLVNQAYRLHTTAEQAQGRLPFPDPKLSFAEVGELSQGPGPSARRLLGMLNKLTDRPKG